VITCLDQIVVQNNLYTSTTTFNGLNIETDATHGAANEASHRTGE